MKRQFMLACALAAALAALLAPPWLAWREAQRQAYAVQADIALRYGWQMVRRVDDMVRQSLAGVALLSRSTAAPCSAQEQVLMQRIVLSSTYLKAIGRVDGGVLQCSSMGSVPFPLGPHILNASDRMRVYSHVPIAGHGASRLIAIERDGYAVLIDSDQPLDASSAVPGMSLAVLHLDRRPDEPISMASGFVDRAWVRRLGGQSQVTFVDRGLLVAVVRSHRTRSAGVAALPLAYVEQARNVLAWRLVPAAVLAGAALAAVLLLLARRQASLSMALRQALRNDEFCLLYQPVVELASGRWIGVEALLRWRRPHGKPIGPDLFVPLAEQSGMIGQLTERVLQLVEQDTRQVLGIDPHFHVALNLSVTDLHSDAIVGRLDGLLARSGAGPANLIVEITERGILDIGAARNVIGALRERGVGVAIDDFGTGYAGLSYLESLQVDLLKIDRSFIETIGTGAPTNQVVDHIIAMARAMGLAVVAEGIETEAQAAYLRERGVQFAQGWLFGRPMRIDQIAAALAGQRRAGVPLTPPTPA